MNLGEQNGTSRLLGIRGYARHRGCSPSSVVKAIRTERIPFTVDARGWPRIDAGAADAAWRANSDPAKQRDNCRPADPRVHEDPALPLALAKDNLVEIAVTIEKRLSAVFRETARLVSASTPPTRWQRLYAAWSELAIRLEALQAATVEAIPLIRLGAARRGDHADKEKP